MAPLLEPRVRARCRCCCQIRDLGSRNPVHREHGARHCIDACVPPGRTTNEARLDGPGGYEEHVQVLNQAEVRIRGPEGRWPTLPRDDLAHHFRERSFLTAPSSQMSRLLLILRAGSKHSSLRESVKLGKVALKRRKQLVAGAHAVVPYRQHRHRSASARQGCVSNATFRRRARPTAPVMSP